MLSTLLNRTVQIVSRSASDERDEYGNDIATETIVDTAGELQQRQRKEEGDQGEMSDTGWLLILEAGTAIDTGDAVIVDGQIFEVVGDPWDARNPRTQVVSHIEATLRRTGTEEGS